MMFRYFSITVLLLFILPIQTAQAQTVMTLNTGFEFSIHKAQSNAFEMSWYFEKTASTSLLIAFDTNSDGQFKAQEKLDLIRMLKQFEDQDYLLQLKQGGFSIKPESINVITIAVNNGLVAVTFGVLLPHPVNLQKTGLNLAFVDSVRVAIDQNAVLSKLTGMLAQNCRVKVLENKSIDSHNWHHVICTK